MEGFAEAVKAADELVWGLPMMMMLLGCGLYLSVRTGFLQFRRFGYALRSTLGQALRKSRPAAGTVTPLQALSTALAGTVGTGNIAGVGLAIATGGPGAIFWMWVCALVGMITKYAEVVLSIRFRRRNERGEWVGGPMYYITGGLGRRFAWLAALFALFGSFAAFGIGNMTQVNTIVATTLAVLASFAPQADLKVSKMALMLGLLLALLVARVILGGMGRIGRVAERLVPLMGLCYLAATLVVVIAHAQALGSVLTLIIRAAFAPQAALGGAAGFGLFTVIQKGVGRGIFSNEAGLGSAPIAHAGADTNSPVCQGMFGIFEVFVDTIVLCTLTALAILCSGTVIPYGQSVGAELTIQAFSTVFGARLAAALVALCLSLFAFSTVLGWALYGSRCVGYLLGEKAVKPYQILYVCCVVVGATMRLDLVWRIADTLNALMALPNLMALIGLSGVVVLESRRFFHSPGKARHQGFSFWSARGIMKKKTKGEPI